MSAMPRMFRWFYLLVVVLAGCMSGDDEDIGSLKISVTTSGANPDPDGYTVIIGTQSGQAIAVDGELMLTELAPGEYPARLAGLAQNCFVVSTNPLTVRVTAGAQAAVSFAVSCPAASTYVRLTTQTSGADPDPDGYLVKIGTAAARRVTSQGVINLGALEEGSVPLVLTDLAAHCTPDPGNPASVTVVAGQPNPITLKVSCAAITGGIEVTVATSGSDLPTTGFLVTVDGAALAFASANKASTRVLAGTHTVTLDEGQLPGNCRVTDGNPRTVVVAVGATAQVTFSVACTALARAVIGISTTGQDMDADGYTVNLYDGDYYGGQLYTVAVTTSGTATVSGMLPGTYQVSVTGRAPNCRVASITPTPVVVGTADVSLTIAIQCDPALQLAFVTGAGTGSEINVGNEAGGLSRLTTNAVADSNPAWSPDGSRLAFASARDGNSEIYVMNANGSDVRRLTTSPGADYQPAWSPDGSRIAFVSERDGNAEIYAMGTDGSGITRVTNSTSVDVEPSWSPAGTRILFVSTRAQSNPAVHIMNADGSGVIRLTASPSPEASPTWSPSGANIAFMRASSPGFSLYVMNADGSGVEIRNGYTTGSTSISWGSGDRIAYAGARCDYYSYTCDGFGINVLHADGSATALPFAVASEPAWRP